MIDIELAAETDLVEIFFAAGLPGFPNARRFTMTTWGGPDSPFMMLSDIDDPDIGFVVVTPWVFYPDYEFELDNATAERLNLHTSQDAVVMCVVTLGQRAEDATVNLLGPIVVNRNTLEACQTVLVKGAYQVRTPLASTA